MGLLAVADDLTGANGLAGRWAGRGQDVWVSRDPARLRGHPGSRIHCAETRFLSPGAARTAIQKAWTQAVPAGQICFQKIDSTLRGNPAEESEGLLLATGAPWVAFLPAYPALGRQVLGGAVHVHGRRLDATEYARDPLTPARATRPQDLFPQGLRAHAPLQAVAGGPARLSAWLKRALRRRPRFITFDCATPPQVLTIARASLALGCRHFSGAADLGGALAELRLGKAHPVRRPEVAWMILAGSVSATVFGQLQALRAAGVQWQNRVVHGRGAGLALASGGGNKALCRAMQRLGALALSSLAGREDLEPWRRQQAARGLGAAECADEAVRGLAGWALNVAGRAGDCGWFATGGHTLAALFDAAGFDLQAVKGEVLPEVPLSLAQGPGGEAWVCSKPGGFGGPDVFTRFLDLA